MVSVLVNAHIAAQFGFSIAHISMAIRVINAAMAATDTCVPPTTDTSWINAKIANQAMNTNSLNLTNSLRSTPSRIRAYTGI